MIPAAHRSPTTSQPMPTPGPTRSIAPDVASRAPVDPLANALRSIGIPRAADTNVVDAAPLVAATNQDTSLDRRRIALRLAEALTMPTDPTLFLAQLGVEVGATASRAETSDATATAQRRDEAAEVRRAAHAAAARAARRAERWGRNAPPWVGKFIRAITITAGVAGAAITGGTSLGLAIAGAALMCASRGFVKLAEALGMDPSKAQWIGFACNVAGAALMAGGGFAGGATSAGSATSAASSGASAASASASTTAAAASAATAATATTAATSAASTVAQAATTGQTIAQQIAGVLDRVATIVEATAQTARGTQDVGAAVHAHRSEAHQHDADAASVDVERADARLRALSSDMQQTLAVFADVRERLLAVAEVEQARSLAIAASIGR